MNPNLTKTLAFVGAAALVALVGLDIPALDTFDLPLTSIAGWLIGWSGFKRPGDQ